MYDHKLSSPALQAAHQSRPHIIEPLEAVRAQRKLTLIIAGPGFGKTMLMAEWFSLLPNKVWYQLGADDDDVVTFTRTLIAGVQRARPDCGEQTLGLLPRPGMPAPDPKTIGSTVAAELSRGSAASQPLTIFLDDYHNIAHPAAVGALLEAFLERMPAAAHLVIASRHAVDFKYARLRAQNAVTLVDEDVLRFRPSEAAAFLGNSLKTTQPEIVTLMDGWPAGLRLVLLNHERAISPAQPKILRETFRYLAEELFDNLDGDLQDFLLRSAPLRSFTVRACATILDRDMRTVNTYLNDLVRNNIFTSASDGEPTIFRYHDLFLEFLDHLQRERIPEQEMVSIRLKAAHFYHDESQWELAFRHGMTAQDRPTIVKVLNSASFSLRLNGQQATLLRWLARAKRQQTGLFEDNPRLYIAEAMAHFDRNELDQTQSSCHKALEHATVRDDSAVMGRAWLMIGAVAQRWGELRRAQEALSRGVALMQDGTDRDRLVALNSLSVLNMTLGENAHAIEHLEEGRVLAASSNETMAQALVLSNLSTAYTYAGRFKKAIATGREALTLRQSLGQRLGIVASHNNLGYALYLDGQVGEAREILEQGLQLGAELGDHIVLTYMRSNLADVMVAEGQTSLALEAYRTSIQKLTAVNDVRGLAHTWTRVSECHRIANDLAAAEEAADAALSAAEQVGLNELLPAKVALAFVKLRQGDGAGAASLLAPVIEKHRDTTANHCELMRCLWGVAASTEPPANLAYFEEAVRLSTAHGYAFHLGRLAVELSTPLRDAIRSVDHRHLVSPILQKAETPLVDLFGNMLVSGTAEDREAAIACLLEIGGDAAWQALNGAFKQLATDSAKRQIRTALDDLAAQPMAPLHVTMLGHFSVRRGATALPDKWHTRQTRQLFQYLLMAQDREVPMFELAEAIWPGAAPDKVRNRLQNALYHARKHLEPDVPAAFRKERYIIHNGSANAYRLNLPVGSTVDDVQFEALIRRAREMKRQDKLAAAQHEFELAVSLYKGRYLQEQPYEDWYRARADALEKRFVEACLYLLDRYRAHGAHNDVVTFARRLIEVDPYSERAYAHLVGAYRALGDELAAIRACAEWRNAFLEGYDLPPTGAYVDLCADGPPQP